MKSDKFARVVLLLLFLNIAGSQATAQPVAVTATVLPPTISKVFADSQIQLFGPGNTTALAFTVNNPAGNSMSLTGVAFLDTLPSGLVVATPNNLIGTCGGGVIIAIAASNSISLSGATLAVGASCTFSVDVSGVEIGLQVNTTSAITAEAGTITGDVATGSVNVNDLFLRWFFSDSAGGSGQPPVHRGAIRVGSRSN